VSFWFYEARGVRASAREPFPYVGEENDDFPLHTPLSNARFATHEGPHGRMVKISIGIHSGELGSVGSAPPSYACQALCDAAEGGQILLSPAAPGPLEDDDLGDLTISNSLSFSAGGGVR
jgi:hypothetical protein